MNNFETSLLVLLLGGILAFWENIIIWWRGQSYIDYLDDKIASLENIQNQPVHKNRSWLNWVGLSLSVVALLLLDTDVDYYFARQLFALVAIVLNGFAITRCFLDKRKN